MQCNYCSQEPPMKSNKGIYEECSRMLSYLAQEPLQEKVCPNKHCHHNISFIDVIAGPRHYYKDGKQKSGAQRYICRECNRTFTINDNPAAGQNKPFQNALIFRLIVNKMPLQRICEVAQVSMSTLYAKIDFLYEQSQAFAASHERKLPDLPIKRLQISVDGQDYVVNWTDSKDKRNVVIHALGSADNRSGFVFGMHLNIDPEVVRGDIEYEAEACGDLETKPPFRQFARYWLAPDFAAALSTSKTNKSKRRLRLSESIEESYVESELREDIESFEEMTSEVKLPKLGMQIHGEYTIYGHFMFLKRLLEKTEKIRFYMEKESGIRAACLAAFVDDILDKRVDAFYVKINKEMTISQKNAAMARGRYILDEFQAGNSSYKELSGQSLRALLLEENIAGDQFFLSGSFKDKWYLFPAPPKNEPEKAVSWLTDTGSRSYSNFHLAKLMLRASLFGIDRFFMQVRRRISLLERPIGSSSSTGRKWYGFSPYNPAAIVKILEIFRVYHNYSHDTSNVRPRKLLQGEVKRKPGQVVKTYSTPAMRLGLVNQKYEVEEIIEFVRD